MTPSNGYKSIFLPLLLGCVAVNSAADQQILDDLIVDGSACIGQDCVNGESFGFDTLRLKENNLRIHFDDTSNSASFPGNDWRLVANDSSNGGANKFSIEDATAGRVPFTIEAGADANALYVDDSGRTGFGTATPVANLHVVEGNTPTLRLEQDGSSGFTAQTWDVAGNEANFFVRDATNGSKLPFKIKPGAPTSSLFIAADGDIGMGTESPAAALHIKSTDNVYNPLFIVESTDAENFTGIRMDTGLASIDLNNSNSLFKLNFNDGDTQELQLDKDGILQILGSNNSYQPTLLVKNSNAATQFSSMRLETPNTRIDLNNTAGVFRLNFEDGDNQELQLDANGNLTIDGSITTGGSFCGGGCDLVFSPDYSLPSIAEHGKAMWENRFLPNVGPTAENQPFNLTDKLGRMLNELETAHIYIYKLHERIEQLETALDINSETR